MEDLYIEKHRRPAMRANANDRVALMQIWLSIAVLAVILAILFLLPSIFAKLSEQYLRFVSKPQLFDPYFIDRFTAWKAWPAVSVFLSYA